MTEQGTPNAQPDTVTIAHAGGFQAEINPLGAELWRLRDGTGRDLLWDGDPAFWNGRAPILFPIVGALRNDRYRHEGREYALPRHGFARRMRWQLVEKLASAATFRLVADDATRAVYPFDFALEVTFAVAPAELTVSTRVSNTGDSVMPFSYGHHPALCWPFTAGEARADHRLHFERGEPQHVARLDGAGLLARQEPSRCQATTCRSRTDCSSMMQWYSPA